MQYISTRDRNNRVSAAQAIVQGLASDGGLFVPETFPQVSLKFIEGLLPMDYAQRAKTILGLFLDDYTQEELEAAVSAYQTRFEGGAAPLSMLKSGAAMLELWHGPTQAFKDMALQVLPHLMGAGMKKLNMPEEVLILVATSGDTGKAALEGFKDVAKTGVMVFYPDGGVSAAQRLQMVTQEGGNVNVSGVRGNFDDAQTGVKKIFGDREYAAQLKERGVVLSSANSINWGRLVPQVAYYFSAYADMVKLGKVCLGDKVNFCVPTGNFGNILAAYYAMRMGLPVGKLLCASNTNKVLADFIETGVYDRRRDFYKTTSPSMDILISSNLERLLFEISGRDDGVVKGWMADMGEKGYYDIGDSARSAMGEIFEGGWADDARAAKAIKDAFDTGYLMDPHTAVALAVYEEAADKTGPWVIVSTASPYKFSKDVLNALGQAAPEDEFACLKALNAYAAMPIPAQLSALEGKAQRHLTVCEIGDMEKTVSQLCVNK